MTVEATLPHGLQTSVYGSEYKAEYDANTALLDPDRITSGPLAARPAAGVAKRFYYATDQNTLYYDNGAAWTQQTAPVLETHAATHTTGGGDALTLAQSQITNLPADLAAKESAANKGAANGYAPLDAASKVPAANLPVLPQSLVTNLATDLAARAMESAVVHNTGNETVAGLKDFNTGAKIKGVSDGSNASAGVIGEYLTTGPSGTISISNVSPGNIISLSLTAGDWDIWGVAEGWNNGGNALFQAGISANSASFTGTTDSEDHGYGVYSAGGNGTLGLYRRVSISATTTYYLVAQHLTTPANMRGSLRARRVR